MPITPALMDFIPSVSDIVIGLAPLMRLGHAGQDLTPLGQQLMQRAEQNPHDASAMLDFSTVLQLMGHRDIALAIQAEALKMQQLYYQPAEGSSTRLRILVIKGPGDLMANTPIECLLENADVALAILYMSPELPLPAQLPHHDVVFVAVAESDANQPLLSTLGEYLKSWPRPVINAPERIRQLSRNNASQLLKSAPGIEMPVTARVARQLLGLVAGSLPVRAILEDGNFPIIARPAGSHAGQDLCKLDTPADLHAYLQEVAAEQFFVSRFVDYRGADGFYRKYRIAMIAGQPFLCHVGISEHWMIHYLNAGMTESPEKRAEEAHLMATFEQGFARRHAAALAAIQEAVQLDYFAIDCGETMEGKLLVFEVDTAMVVHAMDPVDLFPYKQPPMRKVFDAFGQLLRQAAQRDIS